jgi:xanthine dehydrogenase YagS FAD-binding subunit
MPCNKREPGTGCGALQGVNRIHAIFGWSDKCVATHPSDMCVALAALDAVVKVQGTNGQERSIPFTSYHRLPGDTPRSYYLKVRERSSYAFALVSVAAALEMDGNKIRQGRVAMGGVAHKPWRATETEKFLIGKEATEANFKQAADAEMKNARPLEYNKFKVELGRRAIVRALTQALNGGKV